MVCRLDKTHVPYNYLQGPVSWSYYYSSKWAITKCTLFRSVMARYLEERAAPAVWLGSCYRNHIGPQCVWSGTEAVPACSPL